MVANNAISTPRGCQGARAAATNDSRDDTAIKFSAALPRHPTAANLGHDDINENRNRNRNSYSFFSTMMAPSRVSPPRNTLYVASKSLDKSRANNFCPLRTLVYFVLALISIVLIMRLFIHPNFPILRRSAGNLDDAHYYESAKKDYVVERPFSAKPPRWCKRLIEDPLERPRTSAIFDCRRGRFGAVCEDGKPRFFSQYNQDMWTYLNHWKFLRNRKGVYVDISANEPVRISNTYFFDKCLGWKGLCIEPNPDYTPLLTNLRSCGVLPRCVSDKPVNVTFALDAGSSHVQGGNNGNKVYPNKLKLECIQTKTALDIANIRRVDMLSLDVEGHEDKVLQGIDWKRTTVNVIVMETLNNVSQSLLNDMGYRRAQQPETKEEKAKPGAIFSDHVFLHPDVVWGKPV